MKTRRNPPLKAENPTDPAEKAKAVVFEYAVASKPVWNCVSMKYETTRTIAKAKTDELIKNKSKTEPFLITFIKPN